MGSDVSRVRFDPLRDFAGVVLQQGRLLLDADFNEYVALLDRRLRAETCDLTSFGPDPGHAGVAWVPRQTPDAFRLKAAAGGVTIGRGRMYVDGLVAENHGLPSLALDPLLSEHTGSTDTPWIDQPYGPTPEENLPHDNGPHLAYLDVWQREVTHLEDPELVEVAVGVDTTARHQTTWQVRLLPNVGAITCETDDQDIPGWLDVIRPSSGRLTTDTVDDGTEEPCELPPVAGFSGIENQTYRVEIHEGGAPGTATFKWSRDNGSVAIPVVDKVSSTSLRLATVGKDDVLRVSTGDWVEILDDTYEFRRKPGEVRKVTVDDAARTITFAGALPADLLPANSDDAAARHVRIRRWDQAGVVKSAAGATLVDLDAAGSIGLITVPSTATTQVVLEHRVAISFSVEDGGEFTAGDHWVFAARTADASIERLIEAPPHGVHHHYARLGVVTLPGTFDPDCRRLWPPTGTEDESCDCTVCVTVDSLERGMTIQDAINIVKETGGTVCLGPGTYDIAAGIDLKGARSVRLRGQGLATVLVARGTAITVTESVGITVENLAIVSGSGAAPAIRLHTTAGVTLQDLVVLSYPSEGNGSAIEISGVGVLVALRRNVLVGRSGVQAAKGERTGMLAAGLRIEDNVVVGVDRCVDLGGLAAYFYSCRLSRNELLGVVSDGIVATGAVAPGGSLDVLHNKIASGGRGIVVGTDATVQGNTINPFFKRREAAEGILIETGPIAVNPGHVRIAANRIHDRAAWGITLRGKVDTFMVKQNVLTSVAGGIAIEGPGRATRASIENNQVSSVASGQATPDAAFGILVGMVGAAVVHGNTVMSVGSELVEGAWRVGIAVLSSAHVRVAGNLVDEIGPARGFVGGAAGIVAIGPFENVRGSENSVRFSSQTPAPGDGEWYALLIQSPERGPFRIGRSRAIVAVQKGAVLLNGAWAFIVPARAGHASIAGNDLAGGGRSQTCIVRVRGDVIADGNRFQHANEGIGVLLEGSTIIASSNRLHGDGAMLNLEVLEDRFSAVGNITGGGTLLAGNPLSLPWFPLNPIAS
jgi:Family of unknown function (DUF6519)/Right handed beta helix region